jgi:glycosyltransferase involved in cell wall biosynthesis
VLIGSGPLEAALRHRSADLGLGDRSVFAGSRHDVLELLPGFDVFALSSRFEGLPIALLEAMATGLACVVTRVGGIPEVVTDGRDGLLVEPGDPDALATALGKVLADDQLRADLGRRAADRSEDFQLSAAVRHIERVFLRALG